MKIQIKIMNREYNYTNSFQPGLTEGTRKAIGEAAVRAARAVNYVGAGTEAIFTKTKYFCHEIPTWYCWG